MHDLNNKDHPDSYWDCALCEILVNFVVKTQGQKFAISYVPSTHIPYL